MVAKWRMKWKGQGLELGEQSGSCRRGGPEGHSGGWNQDSGHGDRGQRMESRESHEVKG